MTIASRADSSEVVKSAIESPGDKSSSVIVRVACVSLTVVLMLLKRFICTDSLYSSISSERVATENVFNVSPGVKVSCPEE